MGEKKNEIQPIEKPEESREVAPQMSLPQVLQYAIQKDVGVEHLEKMMELQERYEANEAKKAYHMAMAQFKANPPKINKDAHVNYKSQKTGQVTDYKHATLANVTDAINTALSKHGLSSSWIQDQNNGNIAITCKITHIMGHSESTTLAAAPDASGGKNSIQAVGSTVTYLQRYTLLSLTGLATQEQDDDGIDSEAEYITDDQIERINLLIEKTESDLSLFLSFMKVDRLDKIFVSDYRKAISVLTISSPVQAKEKQS